MKYFKITLILSLFLTFSLSSFSQDISNMSEEQLSELAKARGMTSSEIAKLKEKVAGNKTESKNSSSSTETKSASISSSNNFGHKGNPASGAKKSTSFGFDFFSNPKISFTPNLNLATPTTYQLGPGDELLIDIWGAAENSYSKSIDREGAIRLDNIGPVYVSGLSMKEAKTKIISYLKKIYRGIDAPSSSYNKIHADVSLIGVRTVQVNIIGEISTPGTYSLSALTTVLNALYAAGGPTNKGTLRKIKLVRNGQTLEQFDFYKYLLEGSEKGNVLLQDQDIIIIEPYISMVGVSGNVKRPGNYELKDGETIKDLMKFFSGFKSDAYKERIKVERVNGRQREVSEIVLSQQPNFILKDGDKLKIDGIIDRYDNRISIEGAVYRPGNFELTKGLKLSKLIENAGGLNENAFLERGVIYRIINGVDKEIISFTTKDIVNNRADILLKREDKIHIFSEQELKAKSTVSIDGAINNPKEISFIEKIRIEDLVALAGGFKEGADVTMIDITRRTIDGDFETISQNIKKSSSINLMNSNEEDFFLKPHDRVSVRYLKGHTLPQTVIVTGEVNYPGSYSLSNKDERISDLIEKAGGFSPYAFLEGATLIRKITDIADRQQIKILNEIASKDSLITDISRNSEYKIGIDLEKIMIESNKKSKYDLILKEGDKLIVPLVKQTVEVKGEVLLPTLIRYDKSDSFKDYISKSGGFSENAKKGKSYVIYPNGDVRSTKRFLFFKSYPKLEPGAIVLVPKKVVRESNVNVREVIGITTGIATLGLLINSIVK